MAHKKFAKRRIKLHEKRRIRNRSYKTKMRSAIKEVRNAKNIEEAKEKLRIAQSIIDHTKTRGVIHRNTASRLKSNLSKFIKKLYPSIN